MNSTIADIMLGVPQGSILGTPRACDDLNFLVFVPKFVNLFFLDKLNLSSYEFKKFLINNLNAFYLTFNRNFGFFQY